MVDFSGAAILGNNENQVYDPDSGVWVSTEHMRVAEMINDWEPTLFVVYIPIAERTGDERKPYAIVHAPGDVEPYPVMVFDESQFNIKLLEHLMIMRAESTDVLTILQKRNEAAELENAKKWDDMRADAAEQAAFLLKSKKHVINMGNGRKLDTWG